MKSETVTTSNESILTTPASFIFAFHFTEPEIYMYTPCGLIIQNSTIEINFIEVVLDF